MDLNAQTALPNRIINAEDLAVEIRRIETAQGKDATVVAEQLVPWIEARMVAFVAGARRVDTRA